MVIEEVRLVGDTLAAVLAVEQDARHLDLDAAGGVVLAEVIHRAPRCAYAVREDLGVAVSTGGPVDGTDFAMLIEVVCVVFAVPDGRHYLVAVMALAVEVHFMRCPDEELLAVAGFDVELDGEDLLADIAVLFLLPIVHVHWITKRICWRDRRFRFLGWCSGFIFDSILGSRLVHGWGGGRLHLRLD
jgi:hypothetical protein